MSQMKVNEPPRKKLGAPVRRAVEISPAELVSIGDLAPWRPLPRLVQPAIDGVSLRGWLTSHRQETADLLAAAGAILFRGFAVGSAVEFEEIAAAAVGGGLMEYSFRSTPRKSVGGNVYTSTEYPPEQSIPMHNEMSYTSSWPLKVWFFCSQPAGEGGETPIADSRRVYQRLDEAIRQRFADRGVLYVRNYGGGLDLAWEEVFQTRDRGEVERFCRDAGIAAEWQPGGRLRTRQRCQGVADHPLSGERVWFNQAHLFHRSSLDPEMLARMLAELGDDGIPRDARYGDGAPIETSVLDEIRGVYAEESVAFPWQQGDLLMVDNMLVAHGRRPFKGPRKILVAMAEPVHASR